MLLHTPEGCQTAHLTIILQQHGFKYPSSPPIHRQIIASPAAVDWSLWEFAICVAVKFFDSCFWTIRFTSISPLPSRYPPSWCWRPLPSKDNKLGLMPSLQHVLASGYRPHHAHLNNFLHGPLQSLTTADREHPTAPGLEMFWPSTLTLFQDASILGSPQQFFRIGNTKQINWGKNILHSMSNCSACSISFSSKCCNKLQKHQKGEKCGKSESWKKLRP